MAPGQSAAKVARGEKAKTVIAFASSLASRLNKPQDAALLTDLQTHILHLPLPASQAVGVKRNELDRFGTELWNLSTRLRRDRSAHDGTTKDDGAQHNSIICRLRAFAFMLLDSAGSQAVRRRESRTCVRLIKVALKAAKVCVLGEDFEIATRVLERAATYENLLSSESHNADADSIEMDIVKRLRLEYFAVRTALAFRQDRLDTAEHFFARCEQLSSAFTPETAEKLADLLYEVGKDAATKCNHEVAVKWLERACDTLGEQDHGMLSSEAGELRLCVLQSLIQAHMKLKTAEATNRAWHLLELMETDYSEKMVVPLLKIELFLEDEHIDASKYYNVLNRMVRTIVLNDTNFRTLIHHIHKLKDYSNVYACKALDDLLKFRLVREENAAWMEKVIITHIWICTSDAHAEDALEQLQHLFETVTNESSLSLSPPATHAAQTLLWKKVDETAAKEQHRTAEDWCYLCLHPLLEKAGAQNKVKIVRKIIQCALSRQDYLAARDLFSKMPEIGRDDPVTRYLMYKIGIRSGDGNFAAECLDIVCRKSAKDATLLYACVMEAQSIGDKRQAINALGCVLDKYDDAAPAGMNFPALLRATLRLLQSELIKDDSIDHKILEQLCATFEGAVHQAKASRRRPTSLEQQIFTEQELEWFSKNSYNISLKLCAQIPPQNLARLLTVSSEFIKLLKMREQPQGVFDLGLRFAFCEYLAACTYTTLARAEDNEEVCMQNYLEVRKHCQEFRRTAREEANRLSGAAQDDILSKQFQMVKLELEAVLKLQRWDDLDSLFEQCWTCKSSDRYESLADLVLVIHSCLVQASVDKTYQGKVLAVLQKIINLTSRQTGNDIEKLSRWLRCLFNLTLTYDEGISLRCLDQVIQIAQNKHRARRTGTPVSLMTTPPPSSPTKHEYDVKSANKELKRPDRYPATELEWIATSSFNRAIDYYVADNDAKCRQWAEKAMIVAQWLEDDGQLRDLLKERFSALQLKE